MRQQAAEHIFARLKAQTAEVFANRPLGLTLEIVEIDPVGASSTTICTTSWLRGARQRSRELEVQSGFSPSSFSSAGTKP